MSETNGIVTLEELPEKEIYVEVKSRFKNQLRKQKGNIKNISKSIKVSKRILEHWLNDETLLRLDVFKKLAKFLNKDPIKEIHALRGKGGRKIVNPNLPFNFTTKSGVRIVAAMLGDGSLNKKAVAYYNSQNEVIKGFIKDLQNVFGNVEFRIHSQKKKNTIVKRVELPKFCEKIFEKIGIPVGPKVSVNPRIPSFIFNLNKEKIAEFISQVIDDEGSISIASRHLRIKFAVSRHERISNLIEGVRSLLLKLGIESTIYEAGEYHSTRGPSRKSWSIEIYCLERLKRLHSLLNLRHKGREKKFKQLLNSIKINQFPKKKSTSIYIQLMKKIQVEKGYFTSFDLSEVTGRSIGTCRNVILKFKKLNLIECVEQSFAGNSPKPAKYVVK